MLDDQQRAHKIVGFLAGEYVKGWKAFLVAEQIYVAKEKKSSKISNELSHIIQNSCLETSVTALAKITDRHHDAISIFYLFNFAENHLSAFPLLQKENSLNNVILGYRNLLAQLEAILEKVDNQRDQLVAHMDKELLNNPSLHVSNLIVEEELRKTYAFLDMIIYAFANYLDDQADIPVFDKGLGRKITDELSRLVQEA